MQRRELLAAGASLALAGCAVPPVMGEPLRRVGFGSCNDQKLPQGIWDAVLAARPDLFLFGGDNVYCDEPFTPARLQEAYALAMRSPGFAKVLATVPHMAVWEDHDYGLNDGGAVFAGKEAARDAVLAFWQGGPGGPPGPPGGP